MWYRPLHGLIILRNVLVHFRWYSVETRLVARSITASTAHNTVRTQMRYFIVQTLALESVYPPALHNFTFLVAPKTPRPVLIVIRLNPLFCDVVSCVPRLVPRFLPVFLLAVLHNPAAPIFSVAKYGTFSAASAPHSVFDCSPRALPASLLVRV